MKTWKWHIILHSSIPLHDVIINTYVSKINNPKSANREELLKKLNQKLIAEHIVDTTVVFSGSRMYVLLFDLNIANSSAATQTNDEPVWKQVKIVPRNGS